jgi:hypothetical protein
MRSFWGILWGYLWGDAGCSDMGGAGMRLEWNHMGYFLNIPLKNQLMPKKQLMPNASHFTMTFSNRHRKSSSLWLSKFIPQMEGKISPTMHADKNDSNVI